MASTSIDGVVVLYYPDETVKANLTTYADCVGTLYIVDNTEIPHPFFHDVSFPYTLLHSGSNIGLAAAYNLALRAADGHGAAWLLTMDQDTAFTQPEAAVRLFEGLKSVPASAAVCAPLHNSRFVVEGGDWAARGTVMSSGSIVNIAAAKENGGFDERLFIDEVDHAYCLKMRSKGYQVLQHEGIAVSHRLGTVQRGYLMRYKRYVPLRLYYMMRNYLLVRQEYRQKFPDFFDARDRYLSRFFFGQLLSSDVFSKLKMLWCGWRDYRKGRFGKIRNG